VDEALAQLDTARSIDPPRAVWSASCWGACYVNARRPAEAIRPLQDALGVGPGPRPRVPAARPRTPAAGQALPRPSRHSSGQRR
jgi:hypothetical protein